jgi:hypothetical protein
MALEAETAIWYGRRKVVSFWSSPGGASLFWMRRRGGAMTSAILTRGQEGGRKPASTPRQHDNWP